MAQMCARTPSSLTCCASSVDRDLPVNFIDRQINSKIHLGRLELLLVSFEIGPSDIAEEVLLTGRQISPALANHLGQRREGDLAMRLAVDAAALAVLVDMVPQQTFLAHPMQFVFAWDIVRPIHDAPAFLSEEEIVRGQRFHNVWCGWMVCGVAILVTVVAFGSLGLGLRIRSARRSCDRSRWGWHRLGSWPGTRRGRALGRGEDVVAAAAAASSGADAIRIHRPGPTCGRAR
mmetsp:Transcript_22751/g.63490  ORF Transcript_22751/g.63490 Transcript_22751/m.63490 type:complete len:233 (-) Transcript_22751:1270-1968(-)